MPLPTLSVRVEKGSVEVERVCTRIVHSDIVLLQVDLGSDCEILLTSHSVCLSSEDPRKKDDPATWIHVTPPGPAQQWSLRADFEPSGCILYLFLHSYAAPKVDVLWLPDDPVTP